MAGLFAATSIMMSRMRSAAATNAAAKISLLMHIPVLGRIDQLPQPLVQDRERLDALSGIFGKRLKLGGMLGALGEHIGASALSPTSITTTTRY